MTGKTILHYRIIEELGRGGMGVVYKAEDTKLKREVAIKFLPRQIAASDEKRDRFKIEAQAAAALNHPNIATIYAIEEHNGDIFIVMEFIDGKELQKAVSSDQFSVDRAIEYATQIASGLKAAHAKGVTHRDIKSSNIMVTESGQIKIMDFGLAKIGAGAQLTKDHSTLGTAAYMSPEQTRGEKVDQRSDIWSFGVVLYEMITGQLPFRGEYEQAVIYSILNEEPGAITEFRNDVPSELVNAVQKMLAKAPDHRYGQIADTITDLQAIQKRLEKGDAPISPKQEKKVPSIAVLPFVNMSADPENEYFSDGLAEELINVLTKIKGFRVVARTSAFSFKGEKIDVREIGEKLNVETVLEGSVRKAGNRLRITAQLIKVADGYHLWSERYDRELDDVFAIQDEISLAILDRLKVELLGVEKEVLLKQHTEDQEVFSLYLKGRFYYNKYTPPDLKIAAQNFQQAVDRDANYAKAYAGLAEVYLVMGGCSPFFMLPPGEAYPLACAAMKKALALDDKLAEAHAALGGIRYWFERDWAGAEQAFGRALELNPNDAFIHFVYGKFLWVIGRFDAAMVEWERVEALDPLSIIIKSGIGLIHYCARRYDQAYDEFQRVLEMDPNFAHAKLHLGDVFLAKGMHEDARLAYKKAHALIGDQPEMIQRLGSFYAASGDRARAMKYLEKLQAQSKQSYVPPSFIALLYLTLGEHDEMFALL
ncbi:MAG: protein kinase [bacterium]